MWAIENERRTIRNIEPIAKFIKIHDFMIFMAILIINKRYMNSINEKFIKKMRYKSKLSILLITINIALSSFYFGYHNNCFATLNIETMIDIYSIPLSPSTASGFINGIIPFFSILGAVITYYLVTKISRRVNKITCRKYCSIRTVLHSSLLSSFSFKISIPCFLLECSKEFALDAM